MINSVGKNISILYRQFNVFLNHELENSELNAQELMYLGFLYEKDAYHKIRLQVSFVLIRRQLLELCKLWRKKAL